MRRRFVIQLHAAASGEHYDLMIESGESLATWRLDRLPADLPAGESIPAAALADHRRFFLHYQGPLRCGRGSVRIADAGCCRFLDRREGCWIVELLGESVKGVFSLTRLDGGRWLLTALDEAPRRSEASDDRQ